MTVLPRVAAALGVLALGLGGALVVASPAAAATITVTDPGFSGPGTLQQAILDANAAPGSEITFALPGAAPWTIDIPDTDPLPSISESTTITGPGSASLIIHNSGATITGLAADGCTDPVTSVTISGLTVDAFVSSGIEFVCVDLDASDLLLTDNGGSGMLYQSGVSHTATLADVVATGNANGLSLSASDASTISATGLQVDSSTFTGVFAEASGGASIDIGSSDSSDNGQYGFQMISSGTGTSAVLHDSTAAGNSDVGVQLNSNNGAQVEVNRVGTRANVPGNVVGQANSATIAVTDSTADDSPAGGGFGFDVLGGGTLLLTGSSASRNADGGAGASSVASTIAVSGSTFDDNGRADIGGGLLLYGESSSTITVDTTTASNNVAGAGGGIAALLDSDSTLDITSSTVSGNTVTGGCGCGGTAVGGGLFIAGVNGANGRFTLTDSQVTGNEADNDGAGIYFYELGHDTLTAAVGETGGSTVLRTTIDDNHTTSGNGGGVYVDNWSWKTGGSGVVPAITFDRSTISNNTAVLGAGIYADKNTDNNADTGILLLTESTVSGNDGAAAGAIVFAAAFDDGSVQVSHSTVAGNTGGISGGLLAISLGEVVLDHAILADNGTLDLALFGATLTSGWSLVESDGGAITAGTGNIVGADPKLGPLANNGGTTKTMLIAPGSPAYNAGNPAFTGAGLLDQRGQARVYQVVDLGAVEWQPALAHTGTELTPGPPLIAFLLLFSGLAMVAFSRLRSLA